VWIETNFLESQVRALLVAPSRACGLKPDFATCGALAAAGRALTGVWIETHNAPSSLPKTIVAPSRACGLKPARPPPAPTTTEVAPSRACGLKRCRRFFQRLRRGRALTGVWIETAKKRS